MRIAAAIAGLLVLATVLVDAFSTILLPRRTKHRFRPSRFFYPLTWKAWSSIATRIQSGDTRESFLGIYGPLSLIVLVGLWEWGIMAGFACLQRSVGMQAGGRTLRFGYITYLSATTLLTIATGDPQNAASRVLSAMEGGLGLGFVDLMISYLPVLYQTFSSRELRIGLLDARAGSPPSAGELLICASGMPDRLEGQLAGWEKWAAELLDSSLSFPMLVYFRSQHLNQACFRH